MQFKSSIPTLGGIPKLVIIRFDRITATPSRLRSAELRPAGYLPLGKWEDLDFNFPLLFQGGVRGGYKIVPSFQPNTYDY